MATTKSTKAKTKTAKAKTAAASAKSAKVVKTTKANVTVKTVTPESNLRRLYLLSSAVFLLLAVAAGALMSAVTRPVSLGFLASDELASKTSTVFASAYKFIYDVEIRWTVVALLVLSAIVPLLYATRWRAAHRRALNNRVLMWRWIDLAVTGAIMIEIIGLLSGIHDITLLKLTGGFIAVTAILGYIAERQNADARATVWNAYWLSLVTGVVPWLVIATYALGTFFYGNIRSPWYVYAVYAVTLVGFSVLGLTQYKQHKVLTSDYASVERRYALTNLLTKTAFAAILIAGLQK
jgi:hypothetical protein